jgi:hypothetical protein
MYFLPRILADIHAVMTFSRTQKICNTKNDNVFMVCIKQLDKSDSPVFL